MGSGASSKKKQQDASQKSKGCQELMSKMVLKNDGSGSYVFRTEAEKVPDIQIIPPPIRDMGAASSSNPSRSPRNAGQRSPPESVSHSRQGSKQSSSRLGEAQPMSRTSSKQSASHQPARSSSPELPAMERKGSKGSKQSVEIGAFMKGIRTPSKQSVLSVGGRVPSREPSQEPGGRRPSRQGVGIVSPYLAGGKFEQMAVPRHDVEEVRRGSKQSVQSRCSSVSSDGRPEALRLTGVLQEVQRLFPPEDFEITAYACLTRLAPGTYVTFADFNEKKSLNGLRGKCKDHDPKLHVWTLLMEDSRKVRVVPREIAKAIQIANDKAGTVSAKNITGFFCYGDNCIEVNLEASEIQRRIFHEHVVVVPTAPEENTNQLDHNVEEQQPKAPKKAKARPKRSLDDRYQEPEPPEKDFEVDDQVMMKDAGGQRLGVGKIKEIGAREGFVKVEFGTRGGVYDLEAVELKHFTKSRKSAVGLTYTTDTDLDKQ